MHVSSGISLLLAILILCPIIAAQDSESEEDWCRVATLQADQSYTSNVYAGFPDDDHFLYVTDKGPILFGLNNDTTGNETNSLGLLRLANEIDMAAELPFSTVSHCRRTSTIGEAYGLTGSQLFKWNLNSGAVKLLERDARGIWSNVSTHTASAAFENEQIRVWNTNNGELIRQFMFPASFGVAYIDSNEQQSFVGDVIGNVSVFFRGRPPELVRTVDNAQHISANALQFFPNLLRLWIVDPNTVAILMALTDKLELETWHRSSDHPTKWVRTRVIEIPSKKLKGLDTENHGDFVLSFGPREIMTLNIALGTFHSVVELADYPEMKDFQAVSLSQSGQTIVSCCEDGLVAVWRHRTVRDVSPMNGSHK